MLDCGCAIEFGEEGGFPASCFASGGGVYRFVSVACQLRIVDLLCVAGSVGEWLEGAVCSLGQFAPFGRAFGVLGFGCRMVVRSFGCVFKGLASNHGLVGDGAHVLGPDFVSIGQCV